MNGSVRRQIAHLDAYVAALPEAEQRTFGRIFGVQIAAGELVVPPEGFYVGDTEGPILEGEMERAADWAGQIMADIGS